MIEYKTLSLPGMGRGNLPGFHLANARDHSLQPGASGDWIDVFWWMDPAQYLGCNNMQMGAR